MEGLKCYFFNIIFFIVLIFTLRQRAFFFLHFIYLHQNHLKTGNKLKMGTKSIPI